MSSIRIGWASRDVSTDKPVSIPGQFHIRVSKGIMDPVTTTALVLDNGNDCVVFVSCDLVVMRSGLLDEIRAKTRLLRPEIPVEKILASATHAHTGPSHYREGRNTQATGSLNDEIPLHGIEIYSSDLYRAELSTAISEMIAEAWDKRAPGGIAYGYGYAVVAHSRRVCYFDDVSTRPGAVKDSTYGIHGHAVMYGNTDDPNFSHYEAGADHFVNLLYTFDSDGRLSGAIVNIPCPSQNSEDEEMLSADYWHDVRTEIRRRHGDIFILPQCAAAGDLSPRILHYKKAQERRFRLKYGEGHKTEMCARKDIAQRVAQCFDEVLSWAKKDIRREAKIDHRVSRMRLARRIISEEEYRTAVQGLEAEMAEAFVDTGDPEGDLRHNSILVARRNRYRGVIDRWELQKTETTLPMELHVLRVGDIAFASNRFELYMDYQHRIQARSPFEQTFIIQLAGQPGEEGGTYLCTERGEANRSYSASVYCNQASPAAGQQIVEETVRQLKALYEK